MTDKLQPPKLIADLVIREIPGDMLYFIATNTEIGERLRTEFEAGELGRFELCSDGVTGYLNCPWPLDTVEVACYIAKIARCKYTVEFRVESWSAFVEYGEINPANKKQIYSNSFPHPLMMRELGDDSLQFATLDPKIIERIRTESYVRCFGTFSGAPAWASDIGDIRREHLYVGWLFNVREVGYYLARSAGCKYTFTLKEDAQQYWGVTGNSGEKK